MKRTLWLVTLVMLFGGLTAPAAAQPGLPGDPLESLTRRWGATPETALEATFNDPFGVGAPRLTRITLDPSVDGVSAGVAKLTAGSEILIGSSCPPFPADCLTGLGMPTPQYVNALTFRSGAVGAAYQRYAWGMGFSGSSLQGSLLTVAEDGTACPICPQSFENGSSTHDLSALRGARLVISAEGSETWLPGESLIGTDQYAGGGLRAVDTENGTADFLSSFFEFGVEVHAMSAGDDGVVYVLYQDTGRPDMYFGLLGSYGATDYVTTLSREDGEPFGQPNGLLLRSANLAGSPDFLVAVDRTYRTVTGNVVQLQPEIYRVPARSGPWGSYEPDGDVIPVVETYRVTLAGADLSSEDMPRVQGLAQREGQAPESIRVMDSLLESIRTLLDHLACDLPGLPLPCPDPVLAYDLNAARSALAHRDIAQASAILAQVHLGLDGCAARGVPDGDDLIQCACQTSEPCDACLAETCAVQNSMSALLGMARMGLDMGSKGGMR